MPDRRRQPGRQQCPGPRSPQCAELVGRNGCAACLETLSLVWSTAPPAQSSAGSGTALDAADLLRPERWLSTVSGQAYTR